MIPIDLHRQGRPRHRRRRQRIVRLVHRQGAPGGRGEDRARLPPAHGRHRRELPDPRAGRRDRGNCPTAAANSRSRRSSPCDAATTRWPTCRRTSATDRRYAKFADFSIQGTVDAVGKEFGGIDILIHSIAFSREITKLAKRDEPGGVLRSDRHQRLFADEAAASRGAVHGRIGPAGASAVGLTYLGGERVVPYYGGGMSTAKAALQIDAKQLAQQPRRQEHPRQPDLGGPVRVAGGPEHSARRVREVDRVRRRAVAVAAGDQARRSRERHGVPVQPAGVRRDRADSVRGLRLQRDGGVRDGRPQPFAAANPVFCRISRVTDGRLRGMRFLLARGRA